MGQYYRIAYKNNGKVFTNDRKVKGLDYTMAKLMEHSYFGVKFIDAVAKMLEGNKTRLAWIGDYADENDEVSEATTADVSYLDVWGANMKNPTEFKKTRFGYRGKFLVNHDKKTYISFDKYRRNYKKGQWKICPISLLTAIGNGRGGGDYNGTNMDRIGSWAWDELEISAKEPLGYKEETFFFKEEW